MATKISGSCGTNSGGYTFWLEYTVTHQPSSLNTKVSVTAYLKTQGSSTWNTFFTSDTLKLTINIGGNSHTKTWSGMSCTTSKKTYKLCTYSDTFAYSTSARSVSISASTSTATAWKASGYGPGKLSASGSTSIAAQYSTTGTFTATVGAEDSVTMKLASLPTASYARTITWYHKLSSASSYTNDGTTSISASASAGTPRKAISGLIPGMTYNFQAAIRATSSSSNYKSWTANATTTAAAGSVSVSGITPNGATLTVSGMKSTTAVARSVKFYYKKSADSAYTLAATQTIAANDAAGTRTYTYSLLPGTAYNFKVELVIGSTVYKTLTASATTPFAGISIPSMLDPEIIIDESERVGHKVLQHRPSAVLYIPWYIPDDQREADSYAGTTFKVYIQHGQGDPVLAESILGSDVPASSITVFDENELSGRKAHTWYWHATEYDASSWLPEEDEEITMYVTATNAFGDSFTSQPITGIVGRYFSWDESKDPQVHPEYNLTADEWNKFYDFIKVAYSLLNQSFPDVQPPATLLAEPGDELAASLYNSMDSYSKGTASSVASSHDAIGNWLNTLPSGVNARVKNHYDNPQE